MLLQSLPCGIEGLATGSPRRIGVVGTENADAVAHGRLHGTSDLSVLVIRGGIDGDVVGELAGGDEHGRVDAILNHVLGCLDDTLLDQTTGSIDFVDRVCDVAAGFGKVVHDGCHARLLSPTDEDLVIEREVLNNLRAGPQHSLLLGRS